MSLQQTPLASLSDREWEVIIVGAGPAGAVCSWFLAEEGHDVLVVDKKRFPRDKACGDLLIADSIAMLDRIGLLDKVKSLAYVIPAIEVFSPSGIGFEIPGSYLSLKRCHLDELLMSHVCQERERGRVTFAQGNVVDVKPGDNDGWAELRCSEVSAPVLARIVVLATGSVVTLPYRQGLVSSKEPSALAFRGYIRSSYHQKNAAISYGKSLLPGYGWVVPLGKDSSGSWLYNIGCGTSSRYTKNGEPRLKKILNTFLGEFPLARLLMKKGEGPLHVQGAPLRCGLTNAARVHKNNIIAIGEAIGTTYPFTGEGIGKAMESGAMSAGIIHDALASGDMSHLSRYSEALAEIRSRYFGYLKAEKWLSHGWLNDFVARRITKSGFLQQGIQECMMETCDPRAVFSLKGLLKSYWK